MFTGTESQKGRSPKDTQTQRGLKTGFQSYANCLPTARGWVLCSSGLGPLRDSVLALWFWCQQSREFGVGSSADWGWVFFGIQSCPHCFRRQQRINLGVESYAARGWVLSEIQSWHFGFRVNRVRSSGLGPMQLGVGSSPGFSPGTLVSASIE